MTPRAPDVRTNDSAVVNPCFSLPKPSPSLYPYLQQQEFGLKSHKSGRTYLAIILAPIPELTLGAPGFIDFKLLWVGPMRGLLLKIGLGTALLENTTGLAD